MRMMLVAALAAAPTLWACSDDSMAYTLANCSDSVLLHLDHREPAPGIYMLAGSADGENFSCEMELPLADGAQPEGEAGCDRPWVHLAYGAGDDGITRLTSIRLDDKAPATLTLDLTLVHAGGEHPLTMLALEPSYDEIAPNGRECGPICRTTEASLAF